ncbi:MAB_1171c family putative transporter [Nocardia sp. NPDC050712]|uniref:MAB_1171c family putative transporter n=1 Tax=Nocardia sp. NPDC050712 TaxID=3155518 RepID=UPI0033F1171A
MSSLVPGFVAWPLTIGIAVLAVGRFLLCRATTLDRVINQLFAWGAVGMLLYRFSAMPGAAGPVYELALGCVVMTTTYLYAIGCIRRGGYDPDTLRRRQRWCGGAGLVAAAAILIAGATARADGQPVEMSLSGPGLVFVFAIGVPVAFNTAVWLRMLLREFRSTDLTSTELALGAGMTLAIGFAWVVQVLSILQLVTGWPQLGPQLPRAELVFTVCLAVNGLAPGFPLVLALVRAARLDRAGRACRRLEPLWRDLTAAVPEIVLRPVAGADPATRVFRMTVEIRDALLHLTPYLPAAAPTENRGGLEDYARRVAHAAGERRAGSAPAHESVTARLPLGGGDFDSDFRQLLDLARVWRRVRSEPPGTQRLTRTGRA